VWRVINNRTCQSDIPPTLACPEIWQLSLPQSFGIWGAMVFGVLGIFRVCIIHGINKLYPNPRT